MKYRLHKLDQLALRDGFYIAKPDGGIFWDSNPANIVKELNKLLRDIKSLEAVRDRLIKNAEILSKEAKP